MLDRFRIVVLIAHGCISMSMFADAGAEGDALSILERRCVQCHHRDHRSGDLSLETQVDFLRGGVSGSPVELANVERSYLLDLIRPVNGKADMPKSGVPLTADEIEVIRLWLVSGANWPADRKLQVPTSVESPWWSFQPIASLQVPNGRTIGESQAHHPIDRWVRSKLAEHGLQPSERADRRTLARRVYFDLLGLPPTPEELAAFVNDHSEDAWERLIDRLLASPRYGERWGRHWLDVAHFADTHGYDKDKPREHAWPYRDYVIRSFNEDKSWSQFIREQIAGDVFSPTTLDGVEALGFLSAGPWDFIGHEELPETKIDGKIARHLDRDDMVRTVIQSFMSLTIGCSQCHDHKFDPISQEEYYRLQGVFAAIDRTVRTYYRDPNLAARHRELQARIDELKTLRMDGDFVETQESRVAELESEIAAMENELARLPTPDQVYVGAVHHGTGNFLGTGAQGGRPRPIYLLDRGDVTRPVREVEAGCMAGLGAIPEPFLLSEGHSEADRRAALADWIASKENAFTWRSIVNRVWQYHFGQGIVATPDDFGRMGDVPSHPELLDWLAAQFRESEQSLKSLHRLILTSETYQQSSLVVKDAPMASAAMEIDPANRLLWRSNLRKLDAESVHDSVLMIAGLLQFTMGGPGYRDFVIERPEHSPHYRYDLADPRDPAIHRRAIYRFVVRSQLQPFMNTLDCADPSIQVGVRNQGNSPLQALTLLNNALILVASEAMAERLMQSGESIERQIASAMEQALGRQPSENEQRILLHLAREHGMTEVCRLLWNLNEFNFIE